MIVIMTEMRTVKIFKLFKLFKFLPEAVHLDVCHAMILLPWMSLLGLRNHLPLPLLLDQPGQPLHLLVLGAPLDSVGAGAGVAGHGGQGLLKQVLSFVNFAVHWSES